MFNTYSYKIVLLAGIQQNQTYKKIKLKFEKKTIFFLKLLFKTLMHITVQIHFNILSNKLLI